MSISFLNLPSELRNEVYTYLFILKEPIDPWMNHQRELNLNFLYTNKIIQHEASSLLYAENTFIFTGYSPKHVARFLDTIGSINRNNIRSIRIDFPYPNILDRLSLEDSFSLDDDDGHVLALIQRDCPNLKTLKMSAYSTNYVEKMLDALDDPKLVARVLALLDARFRGISSLREISVDVYEDRSRSDMRLKMESHGWVINVVERLGGQGNYGDDFEPPLVW